MSQSYRLLREDIPEPRGLGSGRFIAEPRKVRAWVEALPRANAQTTQQELAQALDSLATQKLDGTTRLAVMEELRSAVHESVGLLQQQYAGSALPLPPPKAQAAYQAEAFHLAMAQGYRRAVAEMCAPEGKIPMLRGNSVAQALQRSLWHYLRALGVAWRIYRAPSSGVWQGMHRVYRFAVEQKLEGKAIEDRLAGPSADIRGIYVQALLMAVTNPLAFSQAEQDSLWQVARNFAPRCELLRQAPEDTAPVVPEDADRGPGPGAAGESHAQWLDIRPFSSEVNAAIERARDGYSELLPARGVGVRVSTDMLLRLRRAFGLAAARTHKRLQAGHTLRSVIGLSSLHFYLAGERDFDTFMRQASQHIVHVVDHRAAWASGVTDASRVPVHMARVLDQSLGGYRIAWDNANQIRARVGELVGFSFGDDDELSYWMVGVVRWLRYEPDGGLSAGVELLSRRSKAVGLRLHDRDGGLRPPMRALQIVVVDGGDECCYLTSAIAETEATRIELVREDDEYEVMPTPASNSVVASVDAMLNAGDYVVLRPLRSDAVQDENEEAAA